MSYKHFTTDTDALAYVVQELTETLTGDLQEMDTLGDDDPVRYAELEAKIHDIHVLEGRIQTLCLIAADRESSRFK